MTTSVRRKDPARRYSCGDTLTVRPGPGHRGGLIPLRDSRPVPFAPIIASATNARPGVSGCATGASLGMTTTMITMTTPRAGTG